MTVENLSKLVEALAKLVGVLVWPSVMIYVFSRLRNNISEFLSSLGAVTLKFSGVEASATRKQEAIAALTAAVTTSDQAGTTKEEARSATKEAVRVVSGLNPRRIRQIEGSIALWVDDRPSNNSYERQSLEALGIRFVIALSTEDALQKLAARSYDVIISDMGRPPDARAGYTLLDKIRSQGDFTPFIIYAGSNSTQHRAEARAKGAAGSTNRATELFEMTLSALSI